MNGIHGTEPVVVLLGAGIMTATSAVFLKEFDPLVRMVESLNAAIALLRRMLAFTGG
jgi:hypothetical protein